MYKKQLVAAIKVDGRILRESSGRVELPFGSEYTILLKNLDSVRQQARITVDGQDASGWLVIPAHGQIDVERFVRENMNEGHRFKFIERTGQIEAHRGVKAEDGLIEIEFKREKIYQNLAPYVIQHKFIYKYPTFHPHWTYNSNSVCDMWKYSSSALNAFDPSATMFHQSSQNLNAMRSGSGAINATCSAAPSPSAANVGKLLTAQAICFDKEVEPNLNGITVNGSISDQKFTTVEDFPCDHPEVMVLQLVGKIGSEPIQVAKTVQTKLVCETCGKVSKSSVKFCPNCGTNLEKV